MKKSDAPTSLKPAKPLGTLWTMRHSPFSKAVKIVLHLSNRIVYEQPFIPIISSFLLRLRMGFIFRGTKVTAPILQACNRFYTESLDIAMYIDTNRDQSKPSLFPPEHLPAIREFASVAALLNSYMRTQLINQLRHDLPAAERMFMPRALRNRFFSPWILRVAMWIFQRKYRKESEEATRARVKAALEKVRQALVKCEGRYLRYVCGEQLTYADVIVAESLYFDGERGGKFGHLYKDRELAEAYLDVVAWGRAVRETHYKELLERGR